MIRGVLYLVVLFVIYQVIRVVVKSAIKSYQEDRQQGKRLEGDEMVLDPECRTYIVRDRAVSRQVRGTRRYFCSDQCARRFEEKNRT